MSDVIVIPRSAAQWLTTGERGTSSEAIFCHLTGLDVSGRGARDYPLDPYDVQRCRKLLSAVPEFAARFAEMANVSPQWRRLVENWETICRYIDEEKEDRRGWSESAYRLMRTLEVA